MRAIKMSRNPLMRSAVALVLASAAAQGALAEQAPALEEVTVTAQRYEQKLGDIGMSITALSGDALTQQGVFAPEQLVKMIPGLNYTRSTYGSPVYTVRGVGLYEWTWFNAPAVTIYQDEAALPFAAMSRGAAYDLARVEVLKGPQGTLYGQNSTGGAINFIANRPTSEFKTGADVGFNNFGELNASAFVSGPVTDKVSARLFAAVENGGAWQKAISFKGELGDKRFYTARLLVDVKPTDDLTLSFNVNGWVDHSDTQAGQLASLIFPPGPPPSGLASPRNAALAASLTAVLNAQGVPTNARSANWDPNAFGAFGVRNSPGDHTDGFTRLNDFLQGTMRIDYRIGDVTLSSISSYARYHDNTLTDGSGVPFSSLNGSNGGDDTSYGQEFRVSGTNGPLLWIVGANYASDDTDFFGNNNVFLTPNRTSTIDGGSIAFVKSRQTGVFARGEFAVTNSLTLIAGVRHTSSKLKVDGCTYDSGSGLLSTAVGGPAGGRSIAEAFYGRVIPIAPGACVTLDNATGVPGLQRLELNQNNVPFTAGLNWKAADSTLLYANVSRGFKAADYGAPGAFLKTQLQPARQEKVTAIEAGIKTDLAGDRLRLNSAIFHYDYVDKQIRGKTLNAVLGLISTVLNVPKSTVKGAELDMTWMPVDGLRFQLGANYIDSEIGTFTTTTYGGAFKSVTGEVLPLTPKWQGIGDVEYRTSTAGGHQVYGGVHALYQGATFSGLGEEQQFATPSYTNIDLRVGFESGSGRWNGQLYVNNVTDKYSWNIVSFASPDLAVRYANMPRTYGMRVGYRY
jgi:iron complex outermembrane receptor protein